MNPAWSVIGFTALAGAAQGLVVLLVGALWAGVVVSVPFTAAALALALMLLCAGLGASFFHLGHPERAWRAMAMWRTSWLSREVIVLPAFIAAVALWWLALQVGLRPRASLLPVLVLALVLWWCTAMIYACLRFIAEWAHPLTHVNFVLAGLSSGAVLGCALAAFTGEERLLAAIGPWAAGLTAVAGLVRAASFVRNARLVPRSTLQSATGIRATRLVQMSMGMTGGAFNTREFFHRASASMLRQLKWVALVFGHVLPVVLMAYAIARPAVWPWLSALLLLVPGLLAERWLFFAQARHPQNLYYQVVS